MKRGLFVVVFALLFIPPVVAENAANRAPLIALEELPLAAEVDASILPPCNPDCLLALAEPLPDDPDTVPPMHDRHMQRRREKMLKQEMRKRSKYLEQLRLLKLLEFLDLDENQEAEFISAFHQHRRRLARLQKQRRETIARLAEMVQEDRTSESSVRKATKELSDLDRQQKEFTEKFVTGLWQYLRPVQIAKLIVFQERFEFEMLDQLRSFRERRNGRPMNRP